MAEGDRAEKHPSPAELDRFLLGEMSPRQAAPILTHLIHGCEYCQQRMEPTASMLFGTGERPVEPVLEAGAEYDFPLFKALATARRFVADRSTTKTGTRRTSAPQPLRREAPIAEPPLAVGTVGKDWERCQAFIDQCRALRSSDPENMVLTARLAVVMAERLDGTANAATLADFQARAWGELGNARRVADDLAGAEADLSYAVQRAAQGTGDPQLLARLMDLTASLYTDQRRFDEATRLLDMAFAIYEREGDRHAAGRVLISKGLTTGYAFDVEPAVADISEGLGRIDAARDPRLAMVGIHNLIWCLVECGKVEQAESLFAHSQALFSTQAERLDRIKRIWLEGRIAAALVHDERAEQRFREARMNFEELELFYDMALVSLDMAALWLRAGRIEETRELIDETLTVFRSRGIRREAIGLLLMVREAFQKRQITEAILRSAASELLRLEGSPARRSSV